MKTNYRKLWMRVDKHLDNDMTDMSLYQSERKYEDMSACIISGMVNARLATKYLLMYALSQTDEIFDENSKLSTLINLFLRLDNIKLTKEQMDWAYDMEDWDKAYVLYKDGRPSNKVVSGEKISHVCDMIYKLHCLIDGDELSGWD